MANDNKSLIFEIFGASLATGATISDSLGASIFDESNALSFRVTLLMSLEKKQNLKYNNYKQGWTVQISVKYPFRRL